MYGNMSSPFAARNQRASMYAKVGLETDVQAASPHRLVAMLFDGVFDAMAQATQAIQAGNVELKGRSLSRAVRILDEGLRAALDLSAGQLATDLRELYGYDLILLRPDMHVAWRGNRPPQEALRLARMVTGTCST